MIENNQKEIILLKDLGMQYPKETSNQKYRIGLYKCYCGTEFKTQHRYIANGHTKSCGCYNRQRLSGLKTKHGLAHHRLYKVWCDMINRCNNKKCKSYKYYGGRGITVCDEWHDIKNFIEDMYPTFIDGLSIDRIDNDKEYSKDNCRWATQLTQAKNTRKIQKHNKSGYRGVCFNKSVNKWVAQIRANCKYVYLGCFSELIDAAKAYDQYVIDNNLEHTKNF